ncbi:MAG: AAA family ATPase [Oligoflexales bacterium]|nr:AAA family ATPase [Oligoflexales bacterium]
MTKNVVRCGFVWAVLLFHLVYTQNSNATENDPNLYLYDMIKQELTDEVIPFLDSDNLLSIDPQFLHPEEGESFLTLALNLNQEETIKKLIEIGGFGRNNQFNQSPLTLASQNHSLRVMQSLVVDGCDINHKDNGDHLFVYYLMSRTSPQNYDGVDKLEEFLVELIAQGLDWEHEDRYQLKLEGPKKSRNLLQFSLDHQLFNLSSAILDLSPDLKNQSKYLCLAILENDKMSLERMLDLGLDPNLACSDGDFPIHKAVLRNNSGMVAALKNFNANLDQLNVHNESSLLLASEDCNYYMAKFLIGMGADPTKVYPIYLDNKLHLMNTLDYAQYYKDSRLLEILIESPFVDPVIREHVAADLLKLDGETEEQEHEITHEDDPSKIEFLQEVKSRAKSFGDIYVGGVPQEIKDLMAVLKLDERIVHLYDPDHKQTILFYGPTGSGKTTLANAISADSGYRFFKLIPSIIVSKYIGESENRLAEVFSRLKNYINETGEKIVLFIDEIDSLLTNRGGEGSNVSDINNKISAVFLEYFGEGSDLEQRNFLRNIILIGATNNLEDIPENVRGRFFYTIEMPNPDATTRLAILNHYLNRVHSEKVSISPEEREYIAVELMNGLSARKITHIVQKAARKALLRKAYAMAGGNMETEFDQGIITKEDIIQVMDEDDTLDKTKEEDEAWRRLYM